MCGIVGLISNRTSGFQLDEVKLFNKLLVIDGLNRGMDATGVFQVQDNGDVLSYKNSVNAMVFQADKAYEEFMDQVWQAGRIVIGHNRAATQGAVVPQNSHPFHHEHICLVHNGTLHNHTALADTEVDSEAIAKALVDDDPKDVIPKLSGAYALVWYDQLKEKLFFIRNSQRPLSIAETAGGLIISSELTLTEYLCKRAKIDIKESRDIPVDTLFSMNLDNFKLEWETIKMPTYSYYGNNGGNSHQKNTGSGGLVATTSSSTDGNSVTTLPSNPSPKGTAVFATLEKELREAYKPGNKVLVKVDRIRTNVDQEDSRFFGRIISPGKPVVECTGVLKIKGIPTDGSWYNRPTVGYISHLVTSNCGPSFTISDLGFDKELKTHNGSIGSFELDHIVEEELCEKCAEPLKKEFVSVTSINRTGIGKEATYRCVCPDCISKSLTKPEMLNDFVTRYTALQNGVAECKSASPGSVILDSASVANILH